MDAKLTKRSDVDFVRRSIPGVVVYIIFWPLLCWPLNYYELHPNFALTYTYLFISVSLLRIAHALSTAFVYNKHSVIWRAVLYTLVLTHGCLLSSLLAVIVLNPEYHDMITPISIVVAAIASGSAASLSVKHTLTQLYLATIVLPSIIASLASEEHRYLSFMMLLLWFYFFFLVRRFHTEYSRAFHIEKKLEALNITDSLTGIYNRQYFDNSLDAQWEMASRAQSNISILFLDLDFFKKVNDLYGHLIGDQALCHAAKIFQDVTKRKSDMLARYGGEEFAIILPSTPHKDAIAFAESIRSQLEDHPLETEGLRLNLTVSIGVNTTIPENDMNYLSFLDNADKALYQAKHSGRNKVVSYLDIATES